MVGTEKRRGKERTGEGRGSLFWEEGNGAKDKATGDKEGTQEREWMRQAVC